MFFDLYLICCLIAYGISVTAYKDTGSFTKALVATIVGPFTIGITLATISIGLDGIHKNIQEKKK